MLALLSSLIFCLLASAAAFEAPPSPSRRSRVPRLPLTEKKRPLPSSVSSPSVCRANGRQTVSPSSGSLHPASSPSPVVAPPVLISTSDVAPHAHVSLIEAEAHEEANRPPGYTVAAAAAVPVPPPPKRIPRSFWAEVKRRLWTRMDWLHIHAISGVAYIGLGGLWFLWEMVGPSLGLQQLVPPPSPYDLWQADALSVALLLVGVLNCVSCAPMSKHMSPAKSEGFEGLGVGMTLLGVWEALWVSGFYPPSLEWATDGIGAVFLFMILRGIYTAERALESDLAMISAKYALGRIRTPGAFAEARLESMVIHRIASYPNLLHTPILWNMLVGGREWLDRVLDTFPAESILLYHAAFGMALANAIVFLGATLQHRKLMTSRQWIALQLVVLAPFWSTVVDCLVYGPETVSVNPLDMYAGFI
ncbi:unnamed protein product [Vitrella brassicaformis CCMP3155]|uniref:Sphingomyelin synthase-like domain-containing protein n=2 Tax=Vitrella brassicaformis TaxID=1169539 RepID=A0A0G4EV39_VITBC|nr:unnamed protein product [Vitrella brassicaformis CCMP3155]|eukprot:CEM02202.1 unnamed protein product [Vitrella brassicaformis CCMP3155]